MVAALLIIVSVGFGFTRWPTLQEEQPVPQAAPDAELDEEDDEAGAETPSLAESATLEVDTSDWKTYRDSDWGIEIKYPNDWEASIYSRDIIFTNLSSGSAFAVKKENNPTNLTLDEWFRELALVQGRPTAKASARSVTINGLKAYRLDSELMPPNPLFEVYIADERKRIFTLSAYRENEADIDILNRVLSTFYFIGL